jgi:hypothetical protein
MTAISGLTVASAAHVSLSRTHEQRHGCAPELEGPACMQQRQLSARFCKVQRTGMTVSNNYGEPWIFAHMVAL